MFPLNINANKQESTATSNKIRGSIVSNIFRATFHRQNRLPPLPSYQNVKSQSGKSPSHNMRVQSPNRNDFKDFSTGSGAGGSREFRSPLKQINSRQVIRNQEHGNH